MNRVTPVVYWKSMWVILKDQMEYKIDKDSNKKIAVPKEVLVGVPNKQYFVERHYE